MYPLKLVYIACCCATLAFGFPQQIVNLAKKLSASTTSNTKSQRPISRPKSDRKYFWELNRVAFSLLPLAPGPRRKTIIEEIVKNEIWTLDQIQGIVNVNVPVRSTVVKLKDGGLFVHNPVAPTLECIEMMRTLENQHGPVKIIVLATLGLEHKALAGPFSQYFPEAEIYLQPGQWSFPINMPNYLLGFPIGKKLNEIPSSSAASVIESTPWNKDFDHASLDKLSFKSVGGFGETAFFHRSTGTLIVTDSVVRIPDEPPAIIQEDPRALLFHARDKMTDIVTDTDEFRKRGWRRMALFGLERL